MADDKYTFEQARIRLEEIAAEVRKKDTSLEKSLDLLEEGVRLANICTELVDHTDTSASVEVPGSAEQALTEQEPSPETAEESPATVVDDGTADAVAEDGDGFDDADDAAEEAEVGETDD